MKEFFRSGKAFAWAASIVAALHVLVWWGVGFGWNDQLYLALAWILVSALAWEIVGHNKVHDLCAKTMRDTINALNRR